MTRASLIALGVAMFSAVVLAADTPMANRVATSMEGGYRIIRSNGIPDHQTGQFPSRRNPNAIAPKDYTWRIPLKPRMAAAPIPTGFAWYGVAINGVPMEPGTQEFWNDDRTSNWHYEAIGGTSDLGIDMSLAHVQPNGAYHYHGLPKGLVERLGGDAGKMLLVGWAADGYPIYTANGYTDPKDAKSPVKKMKSSYRLKSGNRTNGLIGPYDGRFTEDFEYVKGLGDLDECNGRFGVTPEFPAGTYHYYCTEMFPFISRNWRGEPDPSFQKQGPPPGTRERKPRREDMGGGQGPGSTARPTPPPRPTQPARPTPPSRRPQ
ncbi:MAG: YHYH protein [Candidatus Sumerlaeaceae bacterium]|nr:YHYH protein [Candidatus Sumerlaeaceae bacterium]